MRDSASQTVFTAGSLQTASFTNAGVVDTVTGAPLGAAYAVEVFVSSIAGSSPTFTPYLSQSADQTTWQTFTYPIDQTPITAPGVYGIPVPLSQRYLRFDGTIGGNSLGATLLGVSFSAQFTASWPP